MWVSELMAADVVMVDPQMSIKDAARMLVDQDVTACPVVDADGALVGVVSGIDLLRHDVPADPRAHLIRRDDPDPPPTAVAEVMTRRVVSLHPHADVADAVAVMDEHGVRSLPVVEDGRVIGMLSRTDVLMALARADSEIAEQVRERLADCFGRHAAAIHVRVDRGVVTVSTADGDIDADVMRRIAETVPGAIRVRAQTFPAETGCVP